MRKLILSGLIGLVVLASLGFTKVEAEDGVYIIKGANPQIVEVKAKVPVTYTVEIPRLLDLGSFNKTKEPLTASVSKEFAIDLKNAEIEYGKSIFVSHDGSDLTMANDQGESFEFQSSLSEGGLEFSHQEIYLEGNNNNLNRKFQLSLEKKAIPSAGDFQGFFNFTVSYGDSRR